MKYAVVGAGAIGSVIGSFPASAGKEVWFLDPYEAHMKAINKSGLTIRKSHFHDDTVEEFNVKVNATTEAEAVGKVDVAILMVKSLYTEGAVENLKKVSRKDTIILTMQNGLGNVDILKRHFNPGNIAYGATHLASSIVEPGVVNPKFPRGIVNYIGSENKELKTVLEIVAGDFNTGGALTAYSDDIDMYVWEKLSVNLGNALQGILRLTARHAWSYQEYADIVTELTQELVSVAEAKGINTTNIIKRARVAIPVENSTKPDHITSTGQDMKAKRLTEIAFLNGYIAREGRRLGIETPYNDAIAKIVSIIERTYEYQF